ncbi:Protein translocation protein SEC63 [Nakaseomyces bracarensis]|uniref:Protein translocation protein SEC63 n=1 Tax=Nakaseomyces bracarensis TaxID=273131 RepID=A0ABR4P0D8_9SACH
MALSYEYDEGSETWPFFMLTLLLMVLIPMTLRQLYKLTHHNDPLKKELADNKRFQEENVKLNEEFESSSIKKFRNQWTSKFAKTGDSLFSTTNLMLVIGWISVALVVQRILNDTEQITQSMKQMFDPYALLGITESATEKDIKSAYRKLSLKFHPDKMSKELTAEERTTMEEMYVQISKAHEALTDPIVKENYLRFGHPDGPQSTSHGIAIPSFLVNGSASPLLVLFYVSLLGVVLPYFVGKWWSRTQSYTRKRIHVITASYFVDRLVNYKPSEIVTVDLIISWISHAQEFKEFFPLLTAKDFEALLQDHIHRRDSGSEEKNQIKYRLVSKCHSLLHGLLDISSGFRNLEVACLTLDTLKCVVQALPNKTDAEILQLPYVDREVFAKYAEKENIHTLGKLFTFDDKKIGEILGIEDESRLKQTLKVASNVPFLKLIRADFVVPGESEVTPSSTPHISLKVLVRSAKHKLIPTEKFPAEMLEDRTDFESLRDPFAIMEEHPLIPQTLSPYFPVQRRSMWCALLCMQKDLKLLQTPVNIERLSFKNLSKHLDKREIKELGDDFDPSEWEVTTIKLPLSQPAPPQPDTIYFRLILKNTDYFGPDLDFTMTMNVQDEAKAAKLTIEEELDQDLKDSEDEETDEDEDDDEDDDDSDYTDIDTDTEDEE